MSALDLLLKGTAFKKNLGLPCKTNDGGEQLNPIFYLQANSIFYLGSDPQMDLEKFLEVSAWVPLFSLFLGGLA